MATIRAMAERCSSADPDPDHKPKRGHENNQQRASPHLEEVRKVEAPSLYATTPPTKHCDQTNYPYHHCH